MRTILIFLYLSHTPHTHSLSLPRTHTYTHTHRPQRVLALGHGQALDCLHGTHAGRPLPCQGGQQGVGCSTTAIDTQCSTPGSKRENLPTYARKVK
jgi:hypothetical protein